ncbi:MAG: conserved phage C-terminal domain-containing protein [Clostridium sp.]|uniref:conserved phage C-terminal domain-containing protein n=1 Tax=Clostridium sp. TaxID=1506 RepID=UPI003073A692
MKHTIMGFQQEKLMELGLDLQDAAILRYFIDFKNTNVMKSEVVDGKVYYWVAYGSVTSELPMLGLKKRAIMKRFINLRDVGVLTHYTKKSEGTYSYFGIGERYLELITSTVGDKDSNAEVKTNIKNENNDDGVHEKAQGCASESTAGVRQKEHRCASEGTTNNPSTKYPFNNNVEKKNLDEFVLKVIDYLNSKTKKNFKANTLATIKLIKARCTEGFTLEDFKVVIDNMVLEWTGTQWEKYLVPTTLFAGKFESYLNAKCKNHIKADEGPIKEKVMPEVIWGGF